MYNHDICIIMKNLHKLFVLNSAATQRTNCPADSFHPSRDDDDDDDDNDYCFTRWQGWPRNASSESGWSGKTGGTEISNLFIR